MRTSFGIRRMLIVVLGLACFSVAASAEKVGPEFLVNTTWIGQQALPSVAALANGTFVVTWWSSQDVSGTGVYGQRFSAIGNPLGGEFPVHTYTPGNQDDPAIAMLTGGGFVVVWASDGQDGSSLGIYGQRFRANGTPIGDEFPVNATTEGIQKSPSVAGLADGGFVVTWSSDDGAQYGIFGQRFRANGQPRGSEFPVNTTTLDDQERSSVTGLADGTFVVVWESEAQDGSSWGVYGRRFRTNGRPWGREFRVNQRRKNQQWNPSIAKLADGGFVAVWTSMSQDGSGFGVFARRYDANRTPVGDEFQVNTYTPSDQQYPSVAGLAGGGFVVTWTSVDQDGSGQGVYGQRYGADGNPVGDEFRVNTNTADFQQNSSVAGLANGNFVVTWESYLQDDNFWGVFGQRFKVP